MHKFMFPWIHGSDHDLCIRSIIVDIPLFGRFFLANLPSLLHCSKIRWLERDLSSPLRDRWRVLVLQNSYKSA